MTAPLVGFAFQHDERRKVYRAAAGYGSDPLESVRYAYDSVSTYLDLGNFRPVGRFAESLEHGIVFDAAEATGLAPHAVHGAVRLIMVAAVALVATRIVAALARSAGAYRHRPVVALFPLVLGTALVANSRGSPLILFPFVFIGAVALVLAVCLAVARDDDMRARPVRGRELLAMALLGAVAATTYDLVYVAPVTAAAFIAARAAAAGMAPRSVLRTAATRKWAALAFGFLAALIPSRIAIAGRCTPQTCYDGSEISLSEEVLSVAGGRLVTGTPPAGWRYNSIKAGILDFDFTLVDLLGNTIWTLLMLAVVVVATRAALDAEPRSRPVATADGRGLLAPTDGDVSARWFRLAAALGILGAVTACSSALVASLSRHQQLTRPPIGQAWRETLLTQVGWSFLIAASVAIVFALVGHPRTSGVTHALAAALAVSLSLTLLANAQIAETYRHDPLASVISQISEATISLDTTEAGNARRCSLIDSYTELTPPGQSISGPSLRDDLDRLMLGRYGYPFCDQARPVG